MLSFPVADLAALDDLLESAPDVPAVFLLWPKQGTKQGDPYLSKTARLRRRLKRLLKEREAPSRLLNLRHTVERIEYQLTASALESSVAYYEAAREHFPETYLEQIRLRLPSYVKIRAVISLRTLRARGACFSGRSGRALRRSGLRANSWTCFRCGAAKRT